MSSEAAQLEKCLQQFLSLKGWQCDIQTKSLYGLMVSQGYIDIKFELSNLHIDQKRTKIMETIHLVPTTLLIKNMNVTFQIANKATHRIDTTTVWTHNW
jgi:hypothetical protein